MSHKFKFSDMVFLVSYWMLEECEYTKFSWSRSSFIIRMAIRAPVDPFRIYKIGPRHFPR